MAEPRPSRFPQFCSERVAAALKDTPVVMVNGPRQCGKTTLVRELINGKRTYLTLDSDTTLSAATDDPAGFLRGLSLATIDEVQRAPALLRAIKLAVDNDRRPGRFLLTGSADILTVPRISESLAGRMEVVTLLPLSISEIQGARSTFLKTAFAGRVAAPRSLLMGADLIRTVLTGGYPEMVRRTDAKRRQNWARGYVRAIVQRDVRGIADVERLDLMPRLLRALALHSGQLVNYTQLGGQLGLNDKTTHKYVGILEQLFLIRTVEPWFRSRLKRLVKSPKVHVLDSGLLAVLSGATPERIGRERALLGPLLESFVLSEILKQTTWAEDSYALHHYRDKDQDEVDLILERDTGELVGVEVKASATVNAADFRGLRKLADACRGDLKLGAVLYDGDTVIPFGDRLVAAPISCLWG